jgi:signal transduction histidine kinase/DNA-binding response OmpR family regulator
VRARTAEIGGRRVIVVTTRDVTESRLASEHVATALETAVEASRLKSEFVATMSHEIRTPMHGVIGMSELILATELSPLQRDYASTLKESASALLAVIDDILDFSKLEANRVELEAVPFDPVQIVSGVVNIVKAGARDKGVGVHSYASPHVPRALRGDATRLRQILLNLVGNAVKFTTEGSVTITSRVEHDDGSTVTLGFSVTDTGIGMAPDVRERLFEPFVQGDGSMTRRFGGTGLGLSISRRLVGLMGGRIWLGDHEGPGTTFCFTVQFERTAESIVPVALPPDALRVLIVDDEASARRAHLALLALWGMHGDSAADATSAEIRLREAAGNGEPYDAVLIAYALPQRTGLEFAAELGAQTEYGKPARILITAFDAAGRKEAALAAGCAAYLTKPVDPSELYDVLSAIERARRERLPAAGTPMRRARVLLAEDSALVRRVARFQLEELRYDTDAVENGEEAVAAVAAGDYELVLMDMRMPVRDGLSAARAIRDAERLTGKHIVIVALTANVLATDRQACLDAGMDDFLTKPLQLDRLRGVLEHWLAGGPG